MLNNSVSARVPDGFGPQSESALQLVAPQHGALSDLGKSFSGYIRSYRVNDNLFVCMSAFRPRASVVQREEAKSADCYQFGCCFEGMMAWRADNGPEYLIKAGGVCGHYIGASAYTSTLPGAQMCRTVSVTATGSWLRSIVPAAVLDAMAEAPVFVPLSHEVNVCARALDACQGETWQDCLVRESRALELIARVLGEVSSADKIARPVGISASDFAALLAAREYIDEHYAEKITIAQLSREVALNEFKLKQGFRTCFSTTVGGYARHVRMQRARELISGEGLLVREAAQRVGYANVSHFIEAYRCEFGTTPTGRG